MLELKKTLKKNFHFTDKEIEVQRDLLKKKKKSI